MDRAVNYIYRDPVEVIWCSVAQELGITIRRDPNVFATWDGKSILTIGTSETLDADDSLAQMVLHEVCHWMVEGEEAFSVEDWGLEFGREDHEAHEFAALRLQCFLADQFGMREFFGSTTNYREFYDQLSSDPLGQAANEEQRTDDPSIILAENAWKYCVESGIANVLRRGICQTRKIYDVVSGHAENSSLWRV